MRLENSTKHQQITELTIQELVQCCLRQDQKAWEEFLRRYVPLIKNMIKKNLYRYKFPKWDDIDVIEDIWMKVFEKIYAGNGLELCTHFDNFDGWLWTIVSSKTVDYFRTKIRSGQYGNPENDTIDPDTIGTDDWLERVMQDNETMETLKNAMVELSGIKNEKIMWAMRLLIVAEEPLSHAEIKAFAETFNHYDEQTIQRKLRDIQERLRSRIAEKQKNGESADKIWHELRRLEYQLKEKTLHKTQEARAEIEELEQKINRKDTRREKMLNDSQQFCRPSNVEIADLIGLPEDQAQQISVFLKRARDKIKCVIQERSFLHEKFV